MPNGPTQIAGSVVEALKSQPLSLALVIMNIGLLGYLYYEGVQGHQARTRELELMYENQRAMQQLLYQCTPPPARSP